MLKDTPEGDSPIIDPEADEGQENKGEIEGGYTPYDSRLTRLVALRALVDTR